MNMNSYSGIYSIAGKVFEIVSQYQDVHIMCQKYRYVGKPDFVISVNKEDVDFERERSTENDQAEERETRSFSDNYLETLAVYRKLAEQMPRYDTVLFHGSCLAVDGCGYLFTAVSGTGKSTHARLWREYLGEKVVMVNDDKPLILVKQDKAVAFGTPWSGKHHLDNDISVTLKSICIIERAQTNSMSRISAYEAYPVLMQQLYRPLDGDVLKKSMVLFDRLLSKVSLWRLKCNMDLEAAEVAYNAMKGLINK